MKPFAVIVGTLIGLVALYFMAYPTTSYRFRITINVDTPQGLKSGSSVMQVRDWRFPRWMTLGESSGSSSLMGDAVFVDLGPDRDGKPRNVVALLALGKRGENLDFYLLPGMLFQSLWKQRLNLPNFRGQDWELSRLPPGTRAELRGGQIPTLVTFSNPADPSSARALLPEGFEQVFGPGYRLANVVIEIVEPGVWPLSILGLTGETVTSGIEKSLPWWGGPDRPAAIALRAAGLTTGYPEYAFKRS